MKVYKTFLLLLGFAALFLQSCGLSTEAGIATGIFQTQQISSLETAAAGGAPVQSAGSSAGGELPSSAAQVSVSQNTNCRSGPGTNYSILTTINAGQPVEVLKTFSDAYVLVNNPAASGDCWLFLQFADSTDFSGFGLPVATQPPTPAVAQQLPANTTATPSLTPSLTPTASQTPSPTPVTITVSITIITGCPNLVYSGRITSSGPATIYYRWERMELHPGPNNTSTKEFTFSTKENFTFTAAGSKTVEDRFTVDSDVFGGWDSLRIITPYEVISPTFDFNCH